MLRSASVTLALLLLLLVPTAMDAATCDTRGNVVLIAGKNESKAIVISDDCTETDIIVDKGTLTASNMGIEKVLSVPDAKDMCV